MNFSYLLILAGISVAIECVLIAWFRPKVHLTIFTFIGVILGIILMVAHFFIFGEISARPLLKAIITAGMISCVIQLVFSVSKFFKRRHQGDFN